MAASTFPNPLSLEAAIQARISTSLGVADINQNVQGVYMHTIPSDVKAARGRDPYVVVTAENGQFVGEFGSDGIRGYYRVAVIDSRSQSNAACMKVLQGVWGDWSASAPSVGPTYGLQQWEPSITGMDSCTSVARLWAFPHTPDVYSYNLTFEFITYQQ